MSKSFKQIVGSDIYCVDYSYVNGEIGKLCFAISEAMSEAINASRRIIIDHLRNFESFPVVIIDSQSLFATGGNHVSMICSEVGVKGAIVPFRWRLHIYEKTISFSLSFPNAQIVAFTDSIPQEALNSHRLTEDKNAKYHFKSAAFTTKNFLFGRNRV